MKPMEPFPPEVSDDDSLARALRREAARGPGWLADDGFSDRVMQRLPPQRRRHAARWWPVIGSLLGGMLMICIDSRWRTIPALFSRMDQPGVMLAVLVMLTPVLLTCLLLLLLDPESD